MNQISAVPANEDASGIVHAAAPVMAPVTTSPQALLVVLDDVHGIITRAVSSARASGRDYVDQCRSAAQAVVAVRPDLSMQDALNAIIRMRGQNVDPASTQNAA